MVVMTHAKFRTGEGDTLRFKLLAAFVVVFALQPAVAWADGPAGSKEKNNSVKCGEGSDTPAGRLYGGANGVESCSDDNGSPDGRIIVSFDGQYASADGDKDNPEQARGFLRLDSSGPTCSTPQKQDSTAGPGEDCG